MSETRRGFEPINFLFGILMGAADIVPGVSGGTVALIVGIYERLIASVRGVATAVVTMLRGQPRAGLSLMRDVEWGLVVPLGIGILAALAAGARVILPLLEGYPIETRAVFFGLIAASLPVPWRRIGERRPVHYPIALVAAVIAFALVGIPPREIVDPSLVIVFLAATVAICAMILPGVSGSFLLLVMGMYEPTLRALNALYLPYIAVFATGAAIGLGAFSKLLHYLLRTHHDVTMAALVGLMAGSLRAIWPYQDETRNLQAPPSVESILVVALLAAIGFAIVYGLMRIGAVSASSVSDRNDVDTSESHF
jgi:putative membrane protein